MMTFRPTVPIWFFLFNSSYSVSDGAVGNCTQILDAPLGCQWTGSYGSRLDSAQAQGVADSATVRTYYHPKVADAMETGRVLVCRCSLDGCFDPDGTINVDCPNLYEVWGAADNVLLANQFLEFKVKRVEKL